MRVASAEYGLDQTKVPIRHYEVCEKHDAEFFGEGGWLTDTQAERIRKELVERPYREEGVMPAKIEEKHILTGTPEVQLDVWDNGTVEVQIGDEVVTAERLTQIVAFVEQHGQIRVSVDAD
jgi:hypothetical protein